MRPIAPWPVGLPAAGPDPRRDATTHEERAHDLGVGIAPARQHGDGVRPEQRLVGGRDPGLRLLFGTEFVHKIGATLDADLEAGPVLGAAPRAIAVPER